MISKPGSLLYQVFKSKCFPFSSFMDSEIGINLSFVWIFWGKEVLEKGLIWRIGDGERVSIYKDRWILRPSTFKSYSLISLHEDEKIKSLIKNGE